MTDQDNPAEMLEGLTLPDGWTVQSRIIPSTKATGGNFSVGYIASHPNHGQAFLKALDYSRAFRAQDTAQVLNAMTRAYLYERDLLIICGDKNMSRVVKALSAGQVEVVPGMAPVNYLVFEEASGDVRAHLDAASTFETAWVLRVLHQVAVGLNQLHSEGIAHQDMKPSNARIFSDQSAKVADLGCADQAGSTSPRSQFAIAGDPKYAPPELLYNYVPGDWAARRQACDLYHLGSILFMSRAFTLPPRS